MSNSNEHNKSSNTPCDEVDHRDLPRRKKANVQEWCAKMDEKVYSGNIGRHTFCTYVDPDVFDSIKANAHQHGIQASGIFNNTSLQIDSVEKFINCINALLESPRYVYCNSGGASIRISQERPVEIRYDRSNGTATISYYVS